MSDYDDFIDNRLGEVPIKKGYIPAESRLPTADETAPPSGGSSVTPPAGEQSNDD